MNFDWWNYGGILRDVFLVAKPETHVHDYLIQLKPGSRETISGHIQINGRVPVGEIADGEQLAIDTVEELGIAFHPIDHAEQVHHWNIPFIGRELPSLGVW